MASCNRSKLLALIVFVGGLTAPAVAQTDLGRFPLARAIPADVFLAVIGRHNPEREFLSQYWCRVKDAFVESGILGDCWEMISDSLEEDQLEQIEGLRKQFGEVCGAVDWHGIFSKESVFAQRYVKPVNGSPYEGVLLGRMDEDSAEANYQAINALLKQVVKFIESRGGKGHISLKEQEKDGWTMTSLGPVEVQSLGIAVARYKDVIAFGFGGLAMLEDSLALLQGKSEAKLLVDSPRFKKALASLPKAEDEIFYWDLANMFHEIKGMMALASEARERKSKRKPAPARTRAADDEDDESEDSDSAADKKPPAHADDEDDADDDADEKMGIALISKVLDELSMFDFVVSVEWTEGYRVHSESVTSLSADAESKRLYPALADQPGVKDFARFIPKEAESFSCSSGVDWVKLYHAIRGFIKDEIPRGEALLKKLDRTQAEDWELNIEKDVLSTLSGGITSITMGGDWVFMLGVRDEDKTRDLMKRLVGMIQQRMGKESGLMLAPVSIEGHKFTSISHPMMMMVGLTSSPVWGCAEGQLMVGSSSKAVKRCLATATGDHANITKNKRWIAQGLKPSGGPLHAIGFQDESKTGEDLQAMIGGLSMASGMIGMFTGGGELPPEVAGLLAKIPPVLAKLGPVAGKINFYESSASYETFSDGRWHQHAVQNYKAPKDVLESDGEASDDDADKPAPKKTDRPSKSIRKQSKAAEEREDGNDEDEDE